MRLYLDGERVNLSFDEMQKAYTHFAKYKNDKTMPPFQITRKGIVLNVKTRQLNRIVHIVDQRIDEGEQTLTHIISGALPKPYRVLEGDHNTLYIKDEITGKHFAVSVRECTDDE